MSKLSSNYLDISYLLPHGYHFNEKILRNLKKSLVKIKYKPQNSDECVHLACQIINRKNQLKDDNFLDILRKVDHVNVVSLHSTFQKNEILFIFMEWIDGGNLLSYIQVNGNLKEKHAKIWFLQLLLGLKHLHDMKIAHFNLSCTSIMLSNNSIKLSGLQFLKDCKNQENVHNKSPLSKLYRAPEINANLQHDPMTADIYSLGVILFIMLNSMFPFSASNVKELIEDQKFQRFSIRASNLHALSEKCQVVIHTLLEPDPKLRWNCEKILSLGWLNFGK